MQKKNKKLKRSENWGMIMKTCMTIFGILLIIFGVILSVLTMIHEEQDWPSGVLFHNDRGALGGIGICYNFEAWQVYSENLLIKTMQVMIEIIFRVFPIILGFMILGYYSEDL